MFISSFVFLLSSLEKLLKAALINVFLLTVNELWVM